MSYKYIGLKDVDNQYVRITRNMKFNIYYDEIYNNMIVFSPYDAVDNVKDIVNATISGYEYLVGVLNNIRGVIVHWTKVESTTSDYIIYYDFEPKDFLNFTYREIVKTLNSVSNEHGNCKFVEIKDGKSCSINK